ncbi:MAG: hypothetical protein WCD79_12110, partial [Chthoniobacteraceae bacterium]
AEFNPLEAGRVYDTVCHNFGRETLFGNTVFANSLFWRSLRNPTSGCQAQIGAKLCTSNASHHFRDHEIMDLRGNPFQHPRLTEKAVSQVSAVQPLCLRASVTNQVFQKKHVFCQTKPIFTL